jgi:hypothetical protein
MFYENIDKYDQALRFGDVIQGFTECTPIINNPHLQKSIDYQIEITNKNFYSILSPCCSISDKIISLAPLMVLRNSFFNNEYLVEDLTRINKKIPAKFSLPNDAWQKMCPEEKQERLSKEDGFVFNEIFVYQKSDLYKEYIIHKKNGNIVCNHLMIDFRNIFKVKCEKIINPNESPLECKVLQLSKETRALLREKIIFYYSRVPKEDII